MKKAEKPKYVLRLPPCPDYDVEGTECWLTDLAREGLLLKKDGLFAGVAVFERAVPQRVQYRLGAAQKDTGLLGDGYEPDPEQVELCAQYGWEYVARRGEFYIYRSHDPAARELNTDPAVQALALKAVKSRSVSAAIYAALWILVFLLAPILKRVGLLRAILELRTPVFLLFAALAVGAVVRSVRELRALRKLQRTLEQGRQPERRSGWRRNAVRCHVVRFVRLGLTAALIIVGCCRITEPAQDHHPSDLEGQLPFASMRDLASADGTAVTDYRESMTGMGFNLVELHSDWLAPSMIDYHEVADVTRADGSVLRGGLYIDYYETASPWLARQLLWEYHAIARRDRSYMPLDAPEVDGCTLAAYEGTLHFPVVLIQRGNVFLYAYFYQFDDPGSYILPLDEWIGILARSLQEA